MSNSQSYYQFGLQKLNYKSAQDLYERLYLRAIVDTYVRIDKSPDIENNIRNRFIWDLERVNPLTKTLIDTNILQLDFERSHFVTESDIRRTDIVFFITGFEKFIIECKCLYQQPSRNNAYFNDGLIRYVDLRYAERNRFAGMIGFVVSGNISEILNNTKNNAANFHRSNTLTTENQVNFNWEYSFVSSHERINNEDILIYHLFFPFLQF